MCLIYAEAEIYKGADDYYRISAKAEKLIIVKF